MIDPMERKHKLSLLVHSVGEYELPVFAELLGSGNNPNTGARRKMKVPDH